MKNMKIMKIITTKKQAAEYLDIPENEIRYFYKYLNKDWCYQDKDWNWHLFRRKNRKYIELTKNINAICIHSFENGDWEYYGEDGYFHLFRFINRKWIELTKGINTKYVNSYPNGNWMYKDENNYFNVFNKNNELIKKYK